MSRFEVFIFAYILGACTSYAIFYLIESHNKEKV